MYYAMLPSTVPSSYCILRLAWHREVMACNGKNSSWFSEAVHVIQHLDVIGQHELLATEGPATHLAGLLPCHGSGREKSRCRFPLGQYGQSLANPKQFHGGAMCYPVDPGRTKVPRSHLHWCGATWSEKSGWCWDLWSSKFGLRWLQPSCIFMHSSCFWFLMVDAEWIMLWPAMVVMSFLLVDWYLQSHRIGSWRTGWGPIPVANFCANCVALCTNFDQPFLILGQ